MLIKFKKKKLGSSYSNIENGVGGQVNRDIYLSLILESHHFREIIQQIIERAD